MIISQLKPSINTRVNWKSHWMMLRLLLLLRSGPAGQLWRQRAR